MGQTVWNRLWRNKAAFLMQLIQESSFLCFAAFAVPELPEMAGPGIPTGLETRLDSAAGAEARL